MHTTRERRDFIRKLRQRGHRVTQERLAVFDAVFALHGHLEVEQILQRMQAQGHQVSRATLYRNLEVMEVLGFVHKIQAGNRRVLYEHLHAGMEHGHLICRECSQVIEFLSPEVDQALARLCREHGFEPQENQVTVQGLCGICAGWSQERDWNQESNVAVSAASR